MERTPLFEVEEKAGANFAEDAGWLMPANYGDAVAEYRQACDAAVVFDVSHHGKIEVRGPDAATFLHNICTNDIKSHPISEAFFCNAQARVLGHAWVCAGTSYWLLVAPGTAEKLVKHLDRYLISERVEIYDRTHDFVQFQLAGPGAPAVFEQFTEGIRKQPQSTFMHAWRHELLGLPGSDVLCAGQAAERWQRLVSMGARPAGLEAYNILRIEAGTPIYGIDIDENHLAPEVSRTKQAISYTKGCYLGQEPIVRIRDLGHVNRTLVGLKVSANVMLRPGAKVLRDGKEVGHITSSAFSPRLGTTIALGYVRRGSEAAGTAVQIEGDGESHAAEVASLPFGGLASAGV